MTTLNALKSMVNYPLSEDNVLAIMIARGIEPNDDFDKTDAQTREFQLAYADLLRFVVTMVNLQQGGSVTQAAVGELRGTANAIYKKYGEVLIGETADTRSTLQMVDWIC
jgi:hypothetical protein